MASPVATAYDAQVGIPLQAGKAYRQRISAAVAAVGAASGGLSVHQLPTQIAAAGHASSAASAALSVSTPGVSLAAAPHGSFAASGALSLTTPAQQAEGTILDASTNTLSTVDPCPAGTCVYSGQLKAAGIYERAGGVIYAEGVGFLAHGAGEWAYWGNEVYRNAVATGQWSRLTAPHDYDGAYGPANELWPWDATFGIFNDNASPVPGRMYQALVWRPGSAAGNVLGELWVLPRSVGYEMQHAIRRACRLNLDTLQWAAASANDGPPTPLGTVAGHALYSTTRDAIYFLIAGTLELWRLTCSTVTWDKVANLSAPVITAGASVIAWAASSEQHIVVVNSDGTDYVLDVLDVATGTVTRAAHAGAAPVWHPAVLAAENSAPGFARCTTNGKFYLYRGRGETKAYRLTPPADVVAGTWTWDKEIFVGAAHAEDCDFIPGRWAWSPQAGVFMWWAGAGTPVQRFKPTLDPAWLPAAGSIVEVGLNTFKSIDPCPTQTCPYDMSPNTNATGVKAIYTNWSTWIFNPDYSPLGAFHVFGGGHNSYHGNQVCTFDLTTLTWTIDTQPHLYDGAPWGTEGFAAWPWDATWGTFNDDGSPLTTHTYMLIIMRPADASDTPKGEMWVPVRTVTRTFGHHIRRSVAYNPQTRAWRRSSQNVDAPLGGGGQVAEGLYSATRDSLFVLLPSVPHLNVLNCKTGLWAQISMGSSVIGSGTYTLDWLGGEGGPERYIVVALPIPNQTSDQGYYLALIDAQTGQKIYPLPTSGPVPTWHPGVIAASNGSPNPAGYASPGFSYCGANGKFYLYRTYGDQFAWTLTPPADPTTGTWVWAIENFTGVIPNQISHCGVYGHFRWVPRLRAFAMWGNPLVAGINFFRPAGVS